MSRYMAALFALLLASPLQGQSLSEKLAQLFILGPWDVPLRVGGVSNPDNPGAGVVANDAFAPAAVEANLAILGFLTNWMSGNVAAVPIGTGFGGATFTFEAGIPEIATVSPGPVTGEPAQTIGRGRLILGANVTGIQFTSVRGVPMDDIRLNFTHQNLDSDQCDAAFGTDCAVLGLPLSENDVLELGLAVDLDLTIASLSFTYGLTDRIDIGAVLPIVHASLEGSSQAQLVPYTASPDGRVATFIAGTPEDPVLSSSQAVEGSATGLGDIGARMKVNLLERGKTGVSLLGDVRFDTGDEADFLGSGHVAVRALGVVSTQFGGFSPHLNLGYLAWSGNSANDGVLATVGFDQVVAPWATLSASFVSEFQVGESVYELPDPVTIGEPFPRTIRPLELPDIRDNALSTAFGVKLMLPERITAVVNALVPVRRGGPRPDFAWSVGANYDF